MGFISLGILCSGTDLWVIKLMFLLGLLSEEIFTQLARFDLFCSFRLAEQLFCYASSEHLMVATMKTPTAALRRRFYYYVES